MSDPAKNLRDRLDGLSRPRLAKCVPPSAREHAEDRAAHAFRSAIEAVGWSQRETARQLGICERLVRDYLAGARQLPAWIPLAMPREGQVAYLTALASDVGPEQGEEARCA